MRKGRFQQSLSEVARRYSESVSFERRLYRHDIAGSIAHVTALVKAGIVSAAEQKQIEAGLREIEKELDSGKFQWDASLEDVHMNIESALTKKIGETGAKLHTARSRNDQIALDLRLYVKDQINRTSSQIKKLQTSLLDLAEKNVDVVMPGYTHLRRAQPILFAHYLLGQVEAFARDVERLNNGLERTDVLPLGSGALAGSTIVLDRELIARELGFARVSQNSLDAVSDRDFVCEFLFCLAMIGMHLSRVSEDLIIWSTIEFDFVEFSEGFSTGSSLMPQKKNPDMAELTRGKIGRLYGNLISILTTLKALPSSYNRDPQEEQEALFDSVDTISAALELCTAMLPESKLNAIAPADLKKLSPLFGVDIADVFDVRRSLAARRAIGAPSPENVKAQIKSWRNQLR